MIKTLLPTPKETQYFDGSSLIIPAIHTEYALFAPFLPVFADAMQRLYSTRVSLAPGGIRVVYDPALAPNAYTLDTREGMVLAASSKEGLCYALASAIHAIEAVDGMWRCERALIHDWPEKQMRGLMVDLAREWIPPKHIYHYMDVCFLLKLTQLHLHFVDDQRYTLPSDAFPKLPTPGEHYTKEDIRGFNEYAAARGITLIPEIEFPGHAGHLTKSYPEVFANDLDPDFQADQKTEEGLALSAHSIICAGKPECMQGVRTLLEEVCRLFPESAVIHIGGDEALIKVWEHCPHCRAYMQENGIEDVYELYSECIARITDMVLELGRTPMVWEGFPAKGAERIDRRTIVIAWENHYQPVQDLLAEGFPIVNGSWQPLYIVDGFKLRWGPREIMAWDVYNWQHWWEHSAATLNPVHIPATNQVLGAEIIAWQTTYEQNIAFVMENCTALSERLWTVKRLWDDQTYHRRHKETVGKVARLIQER